MVLRGNFEEELGICFFEDTEKNAIEANLK